MADKPAKSVERVARKSGKSKVEERNDVIGLVLGTLVTAAGAALTGVFGKKVHENRTGK